jgi:type I restriction enzyme S subunit
MQTLKLTKKYEKYPEYKDSGIEWLGKIPKNWTIERLKYLAPLVTKKVTKEYLQGTYVALENIEAKSGRYIPSEQKVEPESIVNVFENTDVLFGKLRPYLAKVFAPDFSGTSTGEFLVLRPGKKISKKYLFYRILSQEFINTVNDSTYGAQMPRASWNFIGNLEITLPSLREQKNIEDYLNKETTIIDQVIKNKQKLVEFLREKRIATINLAVTRGLDPKVKFVESGTNLIRKIPEGWNLSSLKTLLQSKITDGPHTTPKLLDDGIRFISAESIQANNTIDYSKNRGFISLEDHIEFCKKAKPQKGDIFMVKSGATTGRVAIVEVDSEFSIWSPLALIRTDKRKAQSKYIYFFLQSSLFQDQVKFSWSFGTQQNIGMRVIENLMVTYPSVSEQENIVKYLEVKMSNFDVAINKAEESIEKLKDFKAALISEVVSGKVKV